MDIIDYGLNELKFDQIQLIRRFLKIELNVHFFGFN